MAVHLSQMRLQVRSWASLAFATFALTAVHAQDSAAQQARPIPHIVVTPSHIPLEAERVGASITVLSGSELRENNIPTVADALRTVPGVTVTAHGPRGTLTQVRIRGGEANHLLVLLDGIEINSLGDGGFDFADMPVDDVERIEIIRGPQSGIYGANAHSGVISIVTRSGRGLPRPVVEAKVEAGSWSTVDGSLNVRGATGPAYGSATISGYSTRGTNISHFGGEPDGSRALTVTAKGGLDLAPNLNLEGVVRHTDRFAQSDPQDFDCIFDPVSFLCVPANPATFGRVVDGDVATRYRSTAGQIGARLALFDGHWLQSANVKVFDEHTRGLERGAAVFGADGTRVTVDYKSSVLLRSNLADGERHAFSLLIENRNEHYRPHIPPAEFRKERTGLAGEYVLDLATATTLSAAVRHDWNVGFPDVLTWRFALSQRLPALATRIHASTGKGVTDPNVFELFGSLFNAPNPRLRPERSIGWDAGVEQSFFGGRAMLDVTYFSMDFSDKIELAFNPDLARLIYLNAPGTAVRRGVEVSGSLMPLDWLMLKAAYTYTDARNSEGQIEVRRPPHSGWIEAVAFFAERRGRATVAAIFNGSRRDFFFQPDGVDRIRLPPFTVVRASLSYDLRPAVTAFVRAENLFDARYDEVFSYRAPGFGIFAGLRMRLAQ